MRIQFASDLHLEFPENREFLRVHPLEEKGNILVLAGDILYLGNPKMSAFPFLDWCSEHFSQTLIVPGNHEYYGGFDIAETLHDYELPLRHNVRVLNNRSWRAGDGVELFFTTMWPRYSTVQMLNAQTLMNDYVRSVYKGAKFSAFDVNGIHALCEEWLAGALHRSDAGTKIVVTHHCPVVSPDKERYLGRAASPCYLTDLSRFIEASRPDYWIHGHCHAVPSEGIAVCDTRIYSNPMGYVFAEEQERFKTGLTIDV